MSRRSQEVVSRPPKLGSALTERYYGVCLVEEGSTDTMTIAVRATSKEDAKRRIKAAYGVAAVREVLTAAESATRRREARR